MADAPNATQELASLLIGRPLSEYVEEKRAARPRWAWHLIAEQLAEDTDGKVVVSREALRQWYGEPAEARAS